MYADYYDNVALSVKSPKAGLICKWILIFRHFSFLISMQVKVHNR